jgi:hypothetical protein
MAPKILEKKKKKKKKKKKRKKKGMTHQITINNGTKNS